MARERLLALGDVARRAAEELEAAAQAIAQRLGREEAETSRGELDGEREPVEPAADLDDRRRVVVGDREVGPDRARPVDEQLDRLDPCHLRGRHAAAGLGRQAERRDRVDVLDPDAERLAAGDQELDLGARVEQLGRHPGGGRDLLEVVEHQQDLALAQAFGQRLADRTGGHLAHADGATERQDQAIGVAAGRHVDERDAVAKPRRLLAGGPDGQARLARPARARQRQQPDRRVLEVALDRFELGPATDERRRRDRQARRAVVDGHQRREGRLEVRMDQLEHALRAAEVLEPELAEVAQARAGREAIGAERGGGRRQQDLAAVTDGHEPGGAVDRRAEVVGAASLGVARVERHPDVERAGLAPVGGGQGALGGEARDDALVRGRKDGHQPVTGRLDHDAVGQFDRLAEDHVMTRQGVGHRGRQVLPEPGAPRDVGEQEGQRAGPDDGGGASRASVPCMARRYGVRT